MTTIAGASRYLAAATLANVRGTPAQSAGFLGGGSTVDILEAARSNNGIGLSARARALNQQFINSTRTQFNTLFSSTSSAYLSTESLQTQVLALRASLPASQISDSVQLGEVVDEEV